MSERTEILKVTETLVRGWEERDPEKILSVLLPDAAADVTMFGRNLKREELAEKMTGRAPQAEKSHFLLMNAVAAAKGDTAQESVSLLGTFAGMVDGTFRFFRFQGMFANTLKKENGRWMLSHVRFELTDENGTAWPVLTKDGIPQDPGVGERALVSDWISPKHDDRIGWCKGSEVPCVIAEYDFPEYAIPHSTLEKTDEEQIQETFFRYGFGIDFDSFLLYRDVFTESARVIYGDTRPYDRRGDTMFLKEERAGSCRCIHTGVFDSIKIEGDRATAFVHLFGTYVPAGFHADPESVKENWAWSRYRLLYEKEDGRWKIDQLNWYSGFVKMS